MNDRRQFQEVRVRIAPSPTGEPHVGTASMTLFNYVFARRHGGKFVLRIEDTDLTRSTKESEDAIFRQLRWFGLKWDEGPDVGGPYGPYRQSERVDIYRQHARQLVEKGEAYYCFCTPERLEQVRKAQQAAKQNPAYDGHCRRLPKEDAEARVNAGERHVIRLAVPDDGETTFSDRLRGNITFPNRQIDDQVLLKSDGFPTYHLANVVDDHLMKISHVIRAEEWLSSTPKHVLLYKAFGWDMPTFVHMPILRNPKRGKIAKRDGVEYFALSFYRKTGYLPEALANFLGLMGGSLESGEEVFDVATMARGFSWDRVKTTAPVFDLEKLEWLNGVYIRNLTSEQLTDRLLAGYTRRTADDRARLVKIAPLVKERLKTLSEFDDMTTFFFDEPSPDAALLVPKKRTKAEAAEMLRALHTRLSQMADLKLESVEQMARDISERSGWKTSDLFMCLRVAITGRTVSTPLFQTMEVLGRDVSLKRIEKAAAVLG